MTNILIEIRNNAYHLGDLSLDIVSVDSSLVDSKKEESSHNGHRKRKGVKVHVAVSSEGLPLSFITGLGNEHDSKRFVEVFGMIRIGIGKGRPKSIPEEVDADSAYDNKNLRGYLKQGGIKANIPGNDRNRMNPKRGRPIRFNGESYKIRGSIERFLDGSRCGTEGQP